MSVNGLVVMTPTSIASTGTGNSSSIGANGKVTFSSCTSLSLNGVFSATYDNYMAIIQATTSSAGEDLNGQLRLAGTNANTSYTYQYLIAANTVILGSRLGVSVFRPGALSNTSRNGITQFFFGPALAQPTAFLSKSQYGDSSGYVLDFANTHAVATAYDGFTLSMPTATFTGTIAVYGFNQ